MLIVFIPPHLECTEACLSLSSNRSRTTVHGALIHLEIVTQGRKTRGPVNVSVTLYAINLSVAWTDDIVLL